MLLYFIVSNSKSVPLPHPPPPLPPLTLPTPPAMYTVCLPHRSKCLPRPVPCLPLRSSPVPPPPAPPPSLPLSGRAQMVSPTLVTRILSGYHGSVIWGGCSTLTRGEPWERAIGTLVTKQSSPVLVTFRYMATEERETYTMYIYSGKGGLSR